MYRRTSSTVFSDDSVVDMSTAPTTPDGSLTFSPALQAMRLQDALEEADGHHKGRQNSDSLEATLYSNYGEVKNICCIGAGYVGGPTAAVMAYQNPHLKVTVVDRDANRIAQWKSKHLPIFEPGLKEILRVARDGSKAFTFHNEAAPAECNMSCASSASSECGSQCPDHSGPISIPARQPNLFFSTEISKTISEADIVLIAVNTPTKSKGIGAGQATDMTATEAVVREVAMHAKPGAILVEKSTVPCRTKDMISDILKMHRPNTPFSILSNPEFLAAGTAMTDLMDPNRVLIGCADTPAGFRAARALRSVYGWVPESRIISTNTYSSELAKLVANAMLAQRISSINSISAICERTGADVKEIEKAVGADDRIGAKYLRAGIGFGGSCFGKDVRSLIYLAKMLHLPEVGAYWQQVLDMNEWQRSRFVTRIVRCLNGTLVGKKICVLGYAFKAETDDTRESPALESIKILLEEGPREIAVFDPYCNVISVRNEIARLLGKEALKENGGPIEIYADPYQAGVAAHAVVIMTDCDEFKNTSSSKKPTSVTRPDPRPFERLEPTESELLALHKSLVSTTSSDPLERFEKEPECPDNCAACAAGTTKTEEQIKSGKLDWARITYHMQNPKWVFDGKNVVSVPAMEKLGVRVEAIGKVGWGGV